MANLVPFFVYKHIKDQETARSSADTRKDSTSSSQTESSYGYTGKEYYKHEYTTNGSTRSNPEVPFFHLSKDYTFNTAFQTCVTEAIRNDDKACKIANKIIEESKKLSSESSSRIDQAIKVLNAKTSALLFKLKASVAKVEQLGFEISKTDQILYCIDVDENHNLDFTRIPYELSGAILTKEQIQNGENPFIPVLELFDRGNYIERCKKEYEDSLAHVKKLSKRKLLLLVSSKANEELEEAQKKLSQAKASYNYGLKCQQNVKLFESLTDEQKQILFEYFDAKDELKNASKQLHRLNSCYRMRCGFHVGNDSTTISDITDFYTTELSKAIQSLTEDEIKYFEEFCKNTAIKFRTAVSSDKVHDLFDEYDMKRYHDYYNPGFRLICSSIIDAHRAIEKEEQATESQDQVNIKNNTNIKNDANIKE